MVGLINRHDGSMDTTSVVRLLKLEKVMAQTAPVSLVCCQVGPKHRPQTWADYTVQGETLNPIVLRQVSLKIPEVL